MGDNILSIFFTCILIGISLSMDAFSLALLYGTYGLLRRNEVMLSGIVGLFHFFMPIIGLLFGNVIFRYFFVNTGFVVGIIFLLIGLEMFISSFRDDEVRVSVNVIGFLLFGLSVSIDSLTTGIGIASISDNYLMVSSIFMVISGCFTYVGLRLGGILSERFGRYSRMFGGGLMMLLGIIYIC